MYDLMADDTDFTLHEAAIEDTLKRIQALRPQMTPEEKTLLNLEEEDLKSFAELSDSAAVHDAIITILEEAYKTNPSFKQMIEDDIKNAPEILPKSTRVVSNFLRHLQTVLKPGVSNAIRADRARHAQEMIKSVLKRKIRGPRPAEPAPITQEKVEPLTPDELKMFGLDPQQFTAELKGSALAESLKFFLNRAYIERDGKRERLVNEATKKMPDDQKQKMIYRLLVSIRDMKKAEKKNLGPDLDRDDAGLNLMAKSLVEKTPKKDAPVYTDKFPVITEEISILLPLIRRLRERFSLTGKNNAGDKIKELSDIVDTALPSPQLITDKLEEIQQEVNRLGLTKDEVRAIMNVEEGGLHYKPYVSSESKDNLRADLKKLQDRLSNKTKSDTSGGPSENKEEKAHATVSDSEKNSILDDINNKERMLRALNLLSEKDTSHLQELANSYIDFLREHRDRAKTNLSVKGSDVISDLDTVVDQVSDVARRFNRLAKQAVFQGKWNRPGGRLDRGERSEESVPSVAPQSEDEVGLVQHPKLVNEPDTYPSLKLAVSSATYETMLKDFRGSGPAVALDFLRDIVSQGFFDELEKKMLSILGTPPNSRLNPTDVDYSSNPEAGKGQSLDSTLKLVNKLRTVMGKFKPEEMYNKAQDALIRVADLPSTIKAAQTKKMASFSEVLKKYVSKYMPRLGQDEEADTFEDFSKALPKKEEDIKKKDPGESSFMKFIPQRFVSPAAYYKMTTKEWNELPEAERKEKLEEWQKVKEVEIPKMMEERRLREEQKPGAGVPSRKPRFSPSPAGLFIYGERLTKTGRKFIKNFFQEPTFVPDFVEKMEKAGLNNMLLEGDKVTPLEPGEVDATLAELISKELKPLKPETPGEGKPEKEKPGEFFGSILSTAAMRFAGVLHDLKNTEKEHEEALERLREKNGQIIDLSLKELPKLEKFVSFLLKPFETVKRQVEREEPEHRVLKGPWARMRRVMQKIDDHRTQGDFTLPKERIPKKSEPKVDTPDMTPSNILAVLRSMQSRYKLIQDTKTKFESVAPEVKDKWPAEWSADPKTPSPGGESVEEMQPKQAAETVMLPTEMTRQMFITKDRIKKLEEKAQIEKRPLERAELLKKLYEYALSEYKKQTHYVQSVIQPQMSADLDALEKAQQLLESPETSEMKPDARKQAEEMIESLRSGLENQSKALVSMSDQLVGMQELTNGYAEALEDVNLDLKDGKVQRLYEVATSPEMTRGTPEQREILDRQRERERDRGSLMDISNFKKKMEYLTTRYTKSRGLKAPPGAEKTYVMPSDRIEDVNRKNRENERMLSQIDRMMDLRNKLRQILNVYENSANEIKAYPARIAETEKHMADLDEALKLYESLWGAYKAFGGPAFSDEEKKRYEGLLTQSIREITGNNVAFVSVLNKIRESGGEINEQSVARAFREKYEEEQRSLDTLKKIYEAASQTLPEIEKRIQAIKKQVSMSKPVSTGGTEHNIPQEMSDAYRRLIKKQEAAGTKSVQAAQVGDPYGPTTSPYERALDEKGKMPDYRKEIKRPKGFDILEGFLTDAKEELRILENVKMKGKEWEEIDTETSKDIMSRINQLERIIPTLGEYGNQIVQIGTMRIPLKDAAQKFEDMALAYQDTLRKLMNQRNDVEKRVDALEQKLRQLKEYVEIDPAAGDKKISDMTPEEIDKYVKYVDMGEDEKKNLATIFYKMLYKQMEHYWAQKVGKNIDVFGERDRQWYDNVFRSFQTLAGVRSDRKIMSLLTQYKQAMRSDFGDKKYKKKIQELGAAKKVIEGKYRALGLDSSRSDNLKILDKRIESLKAIQKQNDTVFNLLSQAVQSQIHSGLESLIAEKADEKSNTKDLKEKQEKVVKEVGTKIDEILQKPPEEAPMETFVQEAEDAVVKAEKEVSDLSEGHKMASYKSSAHYNAKILYGPVMQKKIAEMLSTLK